MDITSYRTDAVLELRNPAKSSAVAPISAISRDTSETAPEDEFDFFDAIVDTVNPLQHIPGVSDAYQSITGDSSSALANVAGGFLFGGPVGMAAGAATSFLEMLTGNDLMGHAMALFEGEGGGAADDALGGTHIETAGLDSDGPLLQQARSLSVEQYQAFASAEAIQNQGTGADASLVGWSSTVWTDNALKEAAGLYDSNQNLANAAASTAAARKQETVV